MEPNVNSVEIPIAGHRRRRWVWYALRTIVLLAVIYFVLAYIIAPELWRRATRHHPALDGIPTITHTADGIHGDPLNVALIGTQEQIAKGMQAAGWHPADPITLKSSLRIVGDTVLKHPYDEAPVSNLYLWSRKQDLAFEQPIGNDPRQRHHVRFWKSDQLDEENRPLWIGAATLDTKVGLSHTTGEITHHIGPDVDAERDKIMADLKQAGALADVDSIADFQPEHKGKNGGGDSYETDGRLALGVLAE
jgi:LssY-like putative type I secretion system component LssY